MHHDSFVRDRLLPGIVRDICARRGINYQALSDDWVLKLERDGMVRWVIGNIFDVNGAAAGRLALDKVATYVVLAAADIPAIEHYLVRATVRDPQAREFDTSALPAGPVVIKPLDGMGGRGVERYESADEALSALRASAEPAWAITPYYELMAEYRLVMLDGKLLVAFEKTEPSFRGKLKLFNLGQGGVAADIADGLLVQLQPIAERVMRVTGLRLAAVDIVRTESGELRVLEINSGIMLEHYMQQNSEYKAYGLAVYDAIVAAMFA